MNGAARVAKRARAIKDGKSSIGVSRLDWRLSAGDRRQRQYMQGDPQFRPPPVASRQSNFWRLPQVGESCYEAK